ncbi:anthranilate synthase component I family protein [Paenibacillus bovis]|uniref:Anthranilate synthase n=1 Tax=Paenibacillus bovis TaxID=1616788 RepID=A0A172ZCP8_9BACL|nr:anthranilate synthase component I family protein [Paenibacillus bovis]ANF95132.1 anthranilate synthase [Paenibacillus bovis]
MTRVCISLQDWQQWLKQGFNQLPYMIEVSLKGQLLPDSWESVWNEQYPHSFVLENGKNGRYTYLGLRPMSLLSGQGNEAVIHEYAPINATGQVPQLMPVSKMTGRPLEMLREWMSAHHAPRVEELPPFTGGCVGFLGYDVARSLEKLPQQLQNDLDLPDYVWMKFDHIWVIDHQEGKLYCCVHTASAAEWSASLEYTDQNAMASLSYPIKQAYDQAAHQAERMLEQWNSWYKAAGEETHSLHHRQQFLLNHPLSSTDSREDHHHFTTGFRQEQFEKAVLAVQEYIRQGDVFQVNLSLRSERKISTAPESIYEWLRVTNPSPYMGLLRLPGFQLVSASPELLVSVIGDSVSARPIAGTRRRGMTEQEDQAMEAELTGNDKERAEHIMLVDLQRNDLGRIARYGTVRVPELMTIERYSHVMHLVSGVEAELAADRDVYDVIAAVFPGGTITGAPKIRTMEIIEELEQTRRGAYTGSMGWIDYNGNMELNIIIRTLTVKEDMAYMQAGAGVVIDSNPYREYRECFNKSRALARAVLLSEQYDAALQKREDYS